MIPAKRTYRSTLRAELAEQTRSRIVEAALAEFLEHGYVGTTVDSIARRAEVSRPTVFAIGPKAHLLKLARDRAIAGDDGPRPIAEREGLARVASAADSESLLRACARETAPFIRRFAPLYEVIRQGAAVDPEAHELWQHGERERHDAAVVLIELLQTKGPLREGLSASAAADLLWLLLAPEQYTRLTCDRRWSHRRYTRWFAESMVRVLLP